MATNARRAAARQRGDERGQTESQERTEGAGARSRYASESAASRAGEGISPGTPPPPPGGSEPQNDGEEASEMEFEAEEDELEY